MNYGFLRVACASPSLRVADCEFNGEKIIDLARFLCQSGAEVIVFPELSVTSYTCGDLFLQTALQKSAVKTLEHIAKKTSSLESVILLGLPFFANDALFNCAAILYKGDVLALVPKSFIPNYSEFYEKRYFASGIDVKNQTVFLSEKYSSVPFGTDILIEAIGGQFVLAVELCEDLWTSLPPSTLSALNGANVIANLSASNEIIGKAEYRKNLVGMQSAHNFCAYLYADCCQDESTQDLVFASHNIIAENGTILTESELFSCKNYVLADVDIERLNQERKRTTTFFDSKSVFQSQKNFRRIVINFNGNKNNRVPLLRYVSAQPFVPKNEEKRGVRCKNVISLQSQALAKRLRHINAKSAVIGVSGGLDSTLALLVTCNAFDLCKISRKGILALTMPCFGTTDRTYENAKKLINECGATLKEIDIKKSVLQHFADIGQDENTFDVTYENSQARERTQVLMDLANKNNAIVIGTGDLSELALGWCTYNGDHISMYGVNNSIPKTLVRYLVEYFAKDNLEMVLKDILDTPVSPELIPPKDRKISQKTENLVGPYELHDFFLYYLLRFGFSPKKILFLAEQSDLPYEREVILKWLRVFYKRFFSQQFKRSCLPDGAKIGTVNLSPRGDWRMPSDACVNIWLQEIDKL